MPCLGEELEYLVDMENCSRRLTGGRLKKTTMSAASISASSDETTRFKITVEECVSSVAEMAAADRRGAGSSRKPKSEYFSPRVEKMMRSKSQFSSNVEHEIEHSRVHWSELTACSEPPEDNDRVEEADPENREVFEERDQGLQTNVADFGTRFWRAPDILSVLKDGSDTEFSEKADIYSYGMTCFKIVNGRLPFEGELEAARVSNDLIIEDQRSKPQ